MSDLKYQSKYSTKSLSVFGEPSRSSYKYIFDKTKQKKLHILIVDGLDGIDVLPFAMKGHSITCYETDNKLINGGVVDNFKSLGLIKRLQGQNLSNQVKIINKNFYLTEDKQKYDLVFVSRTIHFERNKGISMKMKINKLMSAVKNGGYIYMFYYLPNDPNNYKKYPVSRYLRYGKMKKFFDLNLWDVFYFRENSNRESIHNAHPYNIEKHSHKTGVIFAQKLLTKRKYVYVSKTKRRLVKTKSIFGETAQQLYDYSNFFNKIYNKNYSCLFVNANDGQNALLFARKGNAVDCYEDNSILLYGGKIDNYETVGLYQRIKDYKTYKNTNVFKENFYKTKCVKKYDFVCSYRTLHLDDNSNISMKKKVRKLMSAVKEGGYLYIYYYLSISDNNDEYPNSQYLENGEIKKFFDLNDWEIIYICEREKSTLHNAHPFNPKDHEHKIGYLLAQKKRNRLKYKYHFTVELNNKFSEYLKNNYN